MASSEMQFDFLRTYVDPTARLIYLWEIKDSTGRVLYRYVGKSDVGAKRPLRHYSRNVRNLMNGRPYRRGNPDGFRKVHHELAKAILLGYKVTLSFLCNVPDGADIYAVEKTMQRKFNC